jgi:hypothetical protein
MLQFQKETLHTIIYKVTQMGMLLKTEKEQFQNSKCSLKKKWMKSVIGSNILENPSDALHRRSHFRNISMNVRFEFLTAMIVNSSIFQDIMPCSLVEVKRHFRGTYCLLLQGQRVSQMRNQHEAGSNAPLIAYLMMASCLAYSSALNIEALCSSEMSLDFHQITQHYISEDRTLDLHELPQNSRKRNHI